MNYFLYLQSGLFVLFLLNIQTSFQISCKNEDNQDVDWFIVYKLPTIENEQKDSFLRKGSGYAFLTSEETNKWTLSFKSVASEESILGRTWQNYKSADKNDSEVAYLFYNDQPPTRHKGKVAAGHSKGHHLLYCHPNIYNSKITTELKGRLDKVARSIFTQKPSFRKKGIMKRDTLLKSKRNKMFIAFAKDNQLEVDIYREIIAPSIHSSLLVQFWSLGRGFLNQAGQKPLYNVTEITSMNMTFANRKRGVHFKSKEDHSKWAISTSAAGSYVCIADLNHRRSQMKRGGGAVCFQSKPVWKTFKSIIKDTKKDGNFCRLPPRKS